MNNLFNDIMRMRDGGKGSGNFGHKGRPGKRGGSGKGVTKALDDNQLNSIWEEYTKRIEAGEKTDHNGILYHMTTSAAWNKNKGSVKKALNKIIETGMGVFKSDADVEEAEKQLEEAVSNGDKQLAEKLKKVLRWNMAIEAMYDVACDLYGEEIKDIQNKEPEKTTEPETKKDIERDTRDLSKGYDITNDTDIFNEKGEAKIEFNDIDTNVLNDKNVGNYFGKDFNLDKQQRFRQIIELNKSQFINFMSNNDLNKKYEGMADVLKEQILDENGIGIFLDYPSLLPDETKNLFFAVAKDIIGDKDYLQKNEAMYYKKPYIKSEHLVSKKVSLPILQMPALYDFSNIKDEFEKERKDFIGKINFNDFEEHFSKKGLLDDLTNFLVVSNTKKLTKDTIKDLKQELLKNKDAFQNEYATMRAYCYLNYLEGLNKELNEDEILSGLEKYFEMVDEDIDDMFIDSDLFDVDLNIPDIMDVKQVNGFLCNDFVMAGSELYTEQVFTKPSDFDLRSIYKDIRESTAYGILGYNGILLKRSMGDFYIDRILKDIKDDNEAKKFFNDFLEVVYDNADADDFYTKYKNLFTNSVKYKFDAIKNKKSVLLYNKDVSKKLQKRDNPSEPSRTNIPTYFATLIGKHFNISSENLYNGLSSRGIYNLYFDIMMYYDKNKMNEFLDMTDEQLDNYINNVELNRQSVFTEICEALWAKDLSEAGYDKQDFKDISKNDFLNRLDAISDSMEDGSYHIEKDNEYANVFEANELSDGLVEDEIKGDLIKGDTTDLDKDIDFISGIKYKKSLLPKEQLKDFRDNRILYTGLSGSDEKEIFNKRLYKTGFIDSKKFKTLSDECMDTFLSDLIRKFDDKKAKRDFSGYLQDEFAKLTVQEAKNKNYNKAATYHALSKLNSINDIINPDVIKHIKSQKTTQREKSEMELTKQNFLSTILHTNEFLLRAIVKRPTLGTVKTSTENIKDVIKSNRINDRYQTIKNKPDVKTNFLDTTVIKNAELNKKWSPKQALDFIKKLIPCLNLPDNFYKPLVMGQDITKDNYMGGQYLYEDDIRERLLQEYKTNSSFAKLRQESLSLGEAEPVLEKIRNNFKNKYKYSYDDLRSLISYITTNGSYYTSALQEDNEGMGSFMRMVVASSPVVDGEFLRFENPSDSYRMYGDIKVGDSITMNAQHFTYDGKSFGKEACKWFGKQCFRVKGKVPFLNMMPYVRPSKCQEWEGLIAGCFKVVKITKGQAVYNANPDVIYDLEFDWDKWKSYIHANSKLFANQIGLYDRNGKMKVKDFLSRLLKMRLLRLS